MKKTLSKLLAIVLLVVGSFFANQYLERRSADAMRAEATGRRSYDTPVDSDHPTLLWFDQTYASREPFLGFAGDLTDNGMDDLIILFHEDGRTDICWMSVAMQQDGGGWTATEAVRAPVENQKVRIFDMDHEGPLEYVITGEKNGNIGYAIFRIMDGELVDLFAEHMKECC